MRILIHDDQGPGIWDLVPVMTRQAEAASPPTPLKVAAILLGVAHQLVGEAALAEAEQPPLPAEEAPAPRIALPGVDFPANARIPDRLDMPGSPPASKRKQ